MQLVSPLLCFEWFNFTFFRHKRLAYHKTISPSSLPEPVTECYRFLRLITTQAGGRSVGELQSVWRHTCVTQVSSPGDLRFAFWRQKRGNENALRWKALNCDLRRELLALIAT